MGGFQLLLLNMYLFARVAQMLGDVNAYALRFRHSLYRPDF